MILLAACDGQATRHRTLMEEIERSICLPQGAYPLTHYARHYAFADRSRITATYVTQRNSIDPARISGIIVDDVWRPLTAGEITAMKVEQAQTLAIWGEAGKRYWHDRIDDVPMIDDGGCEQVNVTYDVAAKRFDYVMCNGGPM